MHHAARYASGVWGTVSSSCPPTSTLPDTRTRRRDARAWTQMSPLLPNATQQLAKMQVFPGSLPRTQDGHAGGGSTYVCASALHDHSPTRTRRGHVRRPATRARAGRRLMRRRSRSRWGRNNIGTGANPSPESHRFGPSESPLSVRKPSSL